MPDSKSKPDVLPQRLCSEIQLFDLCDLASCNHKRDRFCTDPLLLERFEKIAEAELQAPERYVSEEIEDEDEEFAESFEGGEDDGMEDEE